MYNYCLSLHSTGNQDKCQEMGGLLNSYDKSIKRYISHKNGILDMEGQSNCVVECKKKACFKHHMYCMIFWLMNA